jgi:hypothetical protein
MRRAHDLGNPENTQRDERYDPAEVAKPPEHVDARLEQAFEYRRLRCESPFTKPRLSPTMTAAFRP